MDWELVFVWAAIIGVYLAMAMVGVWVFPPMVICLFSTSGDLDICSLGIWNNGYSDEEDKCYNRDWVDEISRSDAECYLERYDDLSEAFGDNIC